MSFSIEEILSIIEKYVTQATKIVGISSTFLITPSDRTQSRIMLSKIGQTSTSVGWSTSEFSIISARIKQLAPNCKIIVGGARTKRDIAEVDKWIDGEGELPISRFLGYQNNFNFNTSQIKWDKSDHIFNGEHLPIEIARGCVFKCSFCSYSLNGKSQHDYVKDPNIVKQELIDNFNRFNTTGYMFSDDTYNDSPKKIENYHKMITSLPFEINFSSYLRLDLIAAKPHTIPLLYESGLRSVFFGVETFNHTTGKHIGKGMDPNKLKDTLLMLKEEWPETVISAGFIIGLPHETVSDIEDTIEWLSAPNCPVEAPSLTVLSLGHRSKMGKDPMTYGITKTASGWKSEWMTSKIAEELVNSTTFSSKDTFTFYNRMRNLDINTYDNLFNIYRNKIL